MDKYEYKVRADEIKALIAEGEFVEAVKIADTIDWRRVKSVMMLCTISDLYKINRRYQESKDILLLAYEKHPTGRLIVYSLCELSIKMEEYVQAIEYYKEFVQIAPRDTGRYILQYRLYEAQDVSLEERIAVLEEFKKRDYREKWAYELAYLYHRIGLTTKCVEECDEMFLWFGEGKYVLKALELKALHVPLNAEQQVRYDTWIALRDAEIEEERAEELAAAESQNTEEPEDDATASDIVYAQDEREFNPYGEEAPTTELPEVKTVDVGQYNTINLQMALAESMKEILEEEQPTVQEEDPHEESELEQTRVFGSDVMQETEALAEEPDVVSEEEPIEEVAEEVEEVEESEELEESEEPSITEKLIAPLLQETVEMPKIELPQDTDELQEISSALLKPKNSVPEDAKQILKEMRQETVTAKEPIVSATVPREESKPDLSAGIPGARTGVLTPLNAKPTKYDDVLSQEYDGQISLAIPDEAAIEKQITGQLSIEDIMAEWEEMKKTNEQKRMEDVRKRILEHTGSLFADFDEATKTGLLEQLEKAFVAAILKESEKPPIKKVILPDEAEKELKAAAQPTAQPQGAVKITSMTNLPTEEKKIVPKPVVEEAVTAEDEVEELEEIEETNIPENVIAKETEIEQTEEAEVEESEDSMEVAESEGTEPEETEPEEVESDSTSDRRQSARELTEEERELFGQFVHHKKSRGQLIHTLDNMSLAACTGNVIITGEEDGSTINLAKGLIREMQYNDSNFSGKVAKVSAAVLNKKDVAETFARLSNGALIIEKASDLKAETATKIFKVLEKDNMGLIVILEDRKQKMNQLLSKNEGLKSVFNLRVDIEPLDDEALVAYAKQYAEDMEYSIDEFGVLALHTRIADMQTSDHEVSLADVRELVDEAIYYANKKTPKHFVDILLAKRYDEEDMIILREKDFMHY